VSDEAISVNVVMLCQGKDCFVGLKPSPFEARRNDMSTRSESGVGWERSVCQCR